MKPLSLAISPRSKVCESDRVTLKVGRKTVVISPAQAVRLAVVLMMKVDPQNVEEWRGAVA